MSGYRYDVARPIRNLTIRADVLNCIRALEGTATIQRIATELQEDAKSVGNAIYFLKSTGAIETVSFGVYKAL